MVQAGFLIVRSLSYLGEGTFYAKFSLRAQGSRVHRNSELLPRIKYRNRGSSFGPRVLPVLWEGEAKNVRRDTYNSSII